MALATVLTFSVASALPAQGFGGALRGLLDSGSESATPEPATTASATPASSRAVVVVPAGTEFEVRLTERLSSADNRVGDRFSGILETDIVHNGRVVVPAGARLTGEVTAAGERQVDGETKNVLAVQPVDMEMNGRRMAVKAKVLRAVTEEEANRSTMGDAAIVGGGVAAGALLGSLLGSSSTATVVGALAGGVAGTIIMATTRDHEAVMPKDSRMIVRLEEPLRIPRS